jgi:RNase P subunit RPR2
MSNLNFICARCGSSDFGLEKLDNRCCTNMDIYLNVMCKQCGKKVASAINNQENLEISNA